jgi:hypothetical protein
VNQRIILSAFKSRYEGNALRGVLAEEANWLEKVSAELRSRTANARPVGKWRMQRFIAWYIDPALGTQKAN